MKLESHISVFPCCFLMMCWAQVSLLEISDLGELLCAVGAPLTQAANTHSHPSTHISPLSLTCRHTDTARLIARPSPRVSFSTAAFQHLPELPSAHSGREEPSRPPLLNTKHQTDWCSTQQTANWLGFISSWVCWERALSASTGVHMSSRHGVQQKTRTSLDPAVWEDEWSDQRQWRTPETMSNWWSPLCESRAS